MTELPARHNQKRTIKALKVYVSPEQQRVIAENARACAMSASAFARSLALGHTPPSILDHREVSNLMKVNADLGRLGGLLKLWLTDDIRYREEHGEPIENLLKQIYATQENLLTVILQITGGSKRLVKEFDRERQD